MITRFRLEAEGDNREDVEEELTESSNSMLAHLGEVQPGDRWIVTDEPTIPVEQNGQAIMYGRRVYRRMQEHDGEVGVLLDKMKGGTDA